ncbi:hypothetical protein [Taklimakanibacter deserti]|uniref:hypothetical protein n=1 Tax=Taklimakanibacter deserti TaxID=2267839 RepID=UPI0013C3E774
MIHLRAGNATDAGQAPPRMGHALDIEHGPADHNRDFARLSKSPDFTHGIEVLQIGGEQNDIGTPIDRICDFAQDARMGALQPPASRRARKISRGAGDGQRRKMKPPLEMIQHVFLALAFDGRNVIGKRAEHLHLMAVIAQRRCKKPYGKGGKGGEVIQIDDQYSPGTRGPSDKSTSIRFCIRQCGTMRANSPTLAHGQTADRMVSQDR